MSSSSSASPTRCARYALQALEKASWLPGSPSQHAVLAQLREDLARIRSHPALRRLELADALTDLNAGRWQITPELAGQLVALATGADLSAQTATDPGVSAEQLAAVLKARVHAWKVLESTSPRLAARHARAIREHFEAIYFSLLPPAA